MMQEMRAHSIPSCLLAVAAISHAHRGFTASLWSQSTNKLHQLFRNSQSTIMDSVRAPATQLPPSSDGSEPPPLSNGDVIISDVIGNTRPINIFAGFTRDIDSVSSLLDTLAENSTILAPLNSAISALPRKPWEDPRDYDALGASAYDGKDGEDRAHRNLRRFTETHIVPESPWKEGEKVKSLGGITLWWEVKDGKAFVQPGDVEVERVASRVRNGEVWVLKGVLDHTS